MAHLVCKAHSRRTLILKPSGKAVHRNGDGSDCDTTSCFIGGQKYVAVLCLDPGITYTGKKINWIKSER